MVTATELKTHLRPGQVQLVDVRSASEYAAGHIAGAINIPMEQIEARLNDLSEESPVVLICQGGKRARIVAELLEPFRRDVIVLDGGTNAWVKAGFPLVVTTRTRWALERQVRLVAGVLVLSGAVLAVTAHSGWIYLCGLVGLGQVLAALTGVCPMGTLLSKMPWNRIATPSSTTKDGRGQSCC